MAHRLTPKIITQNYRAGRYKGSLDAVGIFLDISGFSTITDTLMRHSQHGSEALAILMRQVFEPILRHIFAQQGFVASFAGDAFTALFPHRNNPDRAALRALTAAMLIQQHLRQNPTYHTAYGDFPITAKIGISSGTAEWGILSSRDQRRATYYFRGGPVEDAAKAEHLASAGQVILDTAFYQQFQGFLDVTPLGNYHLLKSLLVPAATPRTIRPDAVDPKIQQVFDPELLRQELRSEFRYAVNLFLSLPDLPDPDLRQIIYHIFDLQQKYAGLIGRIDFGDKGCNIILFWGAPVTYENDIGRALNFVIELQKLIPHTITAGITYYIANAGYIGSELAEFFTCYGRGINLAARLMIRAPRGQFWVDERIYQRVYKHFDLVETGEFSFKGFSQKQTVYTLRGRKPEPERFFQGEMLGRATELSQMEQFITTIWEKKFAGATAIIGEPGIGKSRLLYEFRRSPIFKKNPVQWLRCQSDQILRHSFNPFRYAIRHYFDIDPATSPETARQKLETLLQELIRITPNSDLIDELHHATSFLAALLDIYWPDSLYEKLDAPNRYNSTRAALIALIKAESLRRPIILLIEDAHYLDDDSRIFITYLKRALTSEEHIAYPVAILLATRPDAQSSIALADQTIVLGGLPGKILETLAQSILNGPVDNRLRDLLQENSDGNPFFAEQLLRYLQEEKHLVQQELGSWGLVPGWQKTLLPSDINTVLIARLDQLTHQVKEVIQTASVLGREFEVSILAHMLSQDAEINQKVSEAEKAAIWQPVNQIRYIFKHALLRDAAYSMQMRNRINKLHAIALDALENVYADDLNAHFGELAYHAEQGHLDEKALTYLELAGKEALNTYQLTQAQDYFTRALALTPAQDLRSQYQLLKNRVRVYAWQGKPDLRLADIDTLTDLAEKLQDNALKAQALSQRIDLYHSSARWDDVIALVKLTEPLAHSSGEDNLLVEIRHSAAQALSRLGRFEEALSIGHQALKLAEKIASIDQQALLNNGLGLIYTERTGPGDIETAMRHYSRGLKIARQTENHYYQAQALNNLGKLTAASGQYLAARAYFEQSYELARQISNRPGQGLVLGNLGWVAGLLGEFSAAREYQLRALAISRETDNRYPVAYTLINLSAIAGYEQQPTPAIEYARQGLELARSLNDQPAEGWAQLFMGFGLLLDNRLDEARSAFNASAAIRQETGQPNLRMEALAGLAQTALAAGDIDEALAQTETILSHWAAGGTFDGAEEPLRIFHTCYLVLEKVKDPRAAWIAQNGYDYLTNSLVTITDAETRRRIIENVPWRRAIRDLAGG